MNVKLYNRSKVPDEVLLPLLSLAKRLADAKGVVVVKVEVSATKDSYAVATRRVDEDFLKSRKWRRAWRKSYAHVQLAYLGEHRYIVNDQTMIATDGGYIVLHFSAVTTDAEACAKRLFETAIHEFAHVRDFQIGAPFIYRGANGRMLPHRKRPHEIRAENTVFDGLEKIARSKSLRGKTAEIIRSLAHEIGARYPARTVEEIQWDRSRRFHYKYCRQGTCWYCKQREEGRSKPTPTILATNQPVVKNT